MKTKKTRSKPAARSRAPRPVRRTTKTLYVILAILLGIWNVLLWTVRPESTSAAPSGYTWYYEEQQFMTLLSNRRAALGLQPLATSSCMGEAARAWSQHMSANGLSHSPSSRLDAYCGGGLVSNENIMYAQYTGSAQTAFIIWDQSTPHRANMEGDHTHTGIGFYYDAVKGIMWGTQIFINCNLGNTCPGTLTGAAQSFPYSSHNSECHEQFIPDSVKAGQTFKGVIFWKNTASAPWFPTYRLVATNDHWGGPRVFSGAEIDSYVNPGITATLSEMFTAPSAPGKYDFTWRVATPGGTPFGATCGKTITVGGGAAKPAGPTSAAPAPETQAPTEAPPPEPEPAAPAEQQTAQKPKQAEPKAEAETWPMKLSSFLTEAPATTKIGISGVTMGLVAALIIFHARLHMVGVSAWRRMSTLIRRGPGRR